VLLLPWICPGTLRDDMTFSGSDAEAGVDTQEEDRGGLVTPSDGRLSKIGPPTVLNGEDADQGGDPACWAHLICEECGAFRDGSPHRDNCSRGDDRGALLGL